jgi:putative redox protein
MALHASARRLGRGLRHEVVIDGHHRIVTDEPFRVGGIDSGPAPHELLPAALASCIGTTIALYANRTGWDVDDIEVDVTYENQVDPRRFEVEVRLPEKLSEEQVDRLRKVAASCPVHRALEAGFSFEQRLVRTSRLRRAHAA